MSRLLNIFRGGDAASHTEAMRQSTSLTMAYLMEQNRKFELFMREKVELLESRVAAQSTRDGFELDDGDEIDVDPDETAAEMAAEARPVAPAASADLLEDEDEPLQAWAGAALDARVAHKTAFEAQASDKAPALDPQQDAAVDWQFLLGDQAGAVPPKRTETSSLAGAEPFNDGSEVGEVEPVWMPVETRVLAEEADPMDEAEPHEEDLEREEITAKNLAGPEQESGAEEDELEPAEIIQDAPAEPVQHGIDIAADADRVAEEISVDRLAGSDQNEAWDGSPVAEGVPAAATEITAQDPVEAETASPNLAPPEDPAPDASGPPEPASSAQTRLASALAQQEAADLEPDADSMLPAWLTRL